MVLKDKEVNRIALGKVGLIYEHCHDLFVALFLCSKLFQVEEHKTQYDKEQFQIATNLSNITFVLNFDFTICSVTTNAQLFVSRFFNMNFKSFTELGQCTAKYIPWPVPIS